MDILDGLRALFGFGAETEATRAADPDDLFGMSTAYVTMSANLDYEPIGIGALGFAEIDSTDFAASLDEVREIIEAGDAGTIATVNTDSHGYKWVILKDPDFEDLVVGVHAAADEFIERGYGSRLLAAVFGFEHERTGEYAYWIYSFRRGAYYPFVPTGTSDRDNAQEFKLRSVLDGELDIEDDESYWYPLWPDRAGRHPWE
ncbi:MAG: hypothetical protein ABEH65_01410 [Halobacteriales archaeon]